MIFVFHRLHYSGELECELSEFANVEEAQKFINAKIRDCDNPKIDSFVIISGRELNLRAVEKVTRMEIET